MAVPASATSTNVVLASPSTASSTDSNMWFVPTGDSTLLAALENQQGSDADSTSYSQAFQPGADGPVNAVTWWGNGSPAYGWMVAIHDGVWPTSTSPMLPNGPAVYGALASLSVVAPAAVTTTLEASGLTRYTLSVPTVQLLASHSYRLSVTGLGGGFTWAYSVASGCCNGWQAINWIRGRLISYLHQGNVAFSLDYSGPPPPTTSLSGILSTTSPVAGQAIKLTVGVTSTATAKVTSGTASLSDGGQAIASGTVSAGKVTFNIALPAGDHQLSVAYAGSGAVPSGSTSIAVTVAKAASKITAKASSAKAKAGAVVTMSAKVTTTSPGKGTPGGTVDFTDGATLLCSANLDGAGNGSCAINAPAKGVHSLTATYGGDANRLGGAATFKLTTT